MDDPLTILFAVADTQAWSHKRIVDWADQLILRLDVPERWLVELSLSQSSESAADAVTKGMLQNGSMLPETIGELLAGFILLRFDNGELAPMEAQALLVDVIDAYGAGKIDAEMAGTLELDDPLWAEMRMRAKDAPSLLPIESFMEANRVLLEG